MIGFNLLVIEDEKAIQVYMIDALKEVLKRKKITTFKIITASSLEDVIYLCNKEYYIGVSLDQKISEGYTTKNDLEYGHSASKRLNVHNPFSKLIIYSGYAYQLKITSELGVREDDYYKKIDYNDDQWAEIFLDKSCQYIENGIFEDAMKILPNALRLSLEEYLDADDKVRASIQLYELCLQMFYASVLSVLDYMQTPEWSNYKMINTLKSVKEKIKTKEGVQYREVQKLLSESLFESLEYLRQYRNTNTHSTEQDTTMFTEVREHLANIILHNSYFITNPLMQVKSTEMLYNTLEVQAKKDVGVDNRCSFSQYATPYVNKGYIYQMFVDEKCIVTIDKYFKEDKQQKNLLIRPKSVL